MTKKHFELDLINAIQPIRSYVLATTIYHLFNSGIYDLIYPDPCDIDQMVVTLALDREKLMGFLLYSSNENILEITGVEVCLTEYGKSFSRFRGWYEMLIGGYGNTFLQIGSCLSQHSGSAGRDAKAVGIGSCAISQYDALPLTKKLLSFSSNDYKLALDLGCGNAQYLVEFCHYFPEIKAIGVEPDRLGFLDAQKLVKEHCLSDRIQLINKDALDFFSEADVKPDLVVISFVLHELLGQLGEEQVKHFLKTLVSKYPAIDIVVIEVDNQIDTPEIMRHELSRAYYNPYYLLHYFTNQKLETDAYWMNLFKACGLDIIEKEHPDKNVDSTKLELGYLLRANNANNHK